jgi:hypothetical protein
MSKAQVAGPSHNAKEGRLPSWVGLLDKSGGLLDGRRVEERGGAVQISGYISAAA